MPSIAKIEYSEVSKHKSPQSCWVVLYNKVYDITTFLPSHPGGQASILRLAGQDATEDYDPIHPSGTLEANLPAECLLGEIDQATLPPSASVPMQRKTHQQESDVKGNDIPSSLNECLNLNDIELLATSKLSQRAWAYYFSAGDDLISKTYNNTIYQKILLRPRVFIDVTRCTLHTSLLNGLIDVKLPIYVSPAAQARLAHPSGEGGIANACAKFGALQIISNNASMTPEQIVAASPSTTFGFQIYIQDVRQKSIDMLTRLKALPQVKLLVLTLDAPVPGKREHDERRNISATPDPPANELNDDPVIRAANAKGGVGKALFAGTAMDLTWDTTISWLEKYTDLPIVLKGIQTHEDAEMATKFKSVKGIILSNHGGRALDTAPPSIHTLLEIRKYVPDVFDKIDVWVDGGIKRGTDVVKALCLGAKAVGIGRAALFGLGAGGPEGVEKVFEILKAETKTCIRLLGAGGVSELGMKHVNIRQVEREIWAEFGARL